MRLMKWRDREDPLYEVGDRVMHRNTRREATVLEVKPDVPGMLDLDALVDHDRARPHVEYLVQPDGPLYPGGDEGPTWWAMYHLGPVEG